MDSEEIINKSNRPSPRNLLLVSFSLLAVVHLFIWLQRCFRMHRPPGPFPWPIVGNAPQLGNLPHLYFTRMARKYGNIFQIKLGSRIVVVLNGDAIRTALVNKAVEFAGRPDFTSFRCVSNGKSMAFGNYSEWWRIHRKIAHSTVRAFSTSNTETKRTFENHVVSEVRQLLCLLVTKTAEDKYFNPMSYLLVSTANVMTAVCFGKRYSHTDAEFRTVVGHNDKFARTVGAGSIVDVMPWLQYFPNPVKTLFDQFKTINQEFYDFTQNKVSEHWKTIQSGVVRDMTDAFIFALDRGLDKEYVSPTVNDIFGASQDTLSTALQWIILILARFPDVQNQLREEVDKVVGRSRLPSIEDQPRLPYVMAFIYEVMRYTSFVPITIPHSTTSDTSVLGYHIPKDTVVFVNQWSVNHDPARWSQPDTFNPLRFLDDSGVLDKDLTSNVLIFSLGRRRCIGEDLSKMQLFLFTTLLTHQCVFTSDPERLLNEDYDYGLTLKPKAFRIAVTLRNTMELLDCFVEQQQDRAGMAAEGTH